MISFGPYSSVCVEGEFCEVRLDGIVRQPGKVLSLDDIAFPRRCSVVYKGRCHCGAVQFEVRTELEGLVRCNCSLCARRSAVMHYVAPSDFTLIRGEE
jgi:hypothetical protein